MIQTTYDFSLPNNEERYDLTLWRNKNENNPRI